jgi:L-galactose dehydrogenase/L-glyceraldehyde 3-phosphate reductase
VFQLHTPVAIAGSATSLSVHAVIDEVIPAFEALHRQGKIGCYGFSGTGEPAALPRLIATGMFSVAQVIYNAINSSAGGTAYASVGADFAHLLAGVSEARMGAVAIRVLAGGALSDADARHPVASPGPEPMGSSADYDGDVAVARRLLPLVGEGHAGSLVEAALRFAITQPAISTALIGFSDLAQVETAAAIVAKGPLPAETLERMRELLAPDAGTSRP